MQRVLQKNIKTMCNYPQTPIGEYNPDWAIVVEPRDAHGEPTGEQMLYLVRETKGTTNLDDLRPDEKRKILCGKRHFKDALSVDYKVVTSAEELVDSFLRYLRSQIRTFQKHARRFP